MPSNVSNKKALQQAFISKAFPVSQATGPVQADSS